MDHFAGQWPEYRATVRGDICLELLLTCLEHVGKLEKEFRGPYLYRKFDKIAFKVDIIKFFTLTYISVIRNYVPSGES